MGQCELPRRHAPESLCGGRRWNHKGDSAPAFARPGELIATAFSIARSGLRFPLCLEPQGDHGSTPNAFSRIWRRGRRCRPEGHRKTRTTEIGGNDLGAQCAVKPAILFATSGRLIEVPQKE